MLRFVYDPEFNHIQAMVQASMRDVSYKVTVSEIENH